MLADRALRPAWKKFNVVPLVDRDEYHVYKELLDPATRSRLKKAFQQNERHAYPVYSTPYNWL